MDKFILDAYQDDSDHDQHDEPQVEQQNHREHTIDFYANQQNQFAFDSSEMKTLPARMVHENPLDLHQTDAFLRMMEEQSQDQQPEASMTQQWLNDLSEQQLFQLHTTRLCVNNSPHTVGVAPVHLIDVPGHVNDLDLLSVEDDITQSGQGGSSSHHSNPGNFKEEEEEEDEKWGETDFELTADCAFKAQAARDAIHDLHLDVQRLFGCLIFYQERADGKTSADAALRASQMLGCCTRTVHRYRRAFDKWIAARNDSSVLLKLPMEQQQHPLSISAVLSASSPRLKHKRSSESDDYMAIDSNALPFASTSIPPRRGWLLEEHPKLLESAKQWIQARVDEKRPERDGRPFKIIDFQQWINTELLLDLINDPSSKVNPISHSTARAWLRKLGYYDIPLVTSFDELLDKAYQDTNEHQKKPRSRSDPQKFDKATVGRRSRSNTWSNPRDLSNKEDK